MPTPALRNAGPPSAALLRFLRSALTRELTCCAAPTSTTTSQLQRRNICSPASPPSTRPSPTLRHSLDPLPAAARPFSSTSRTQGLWEHLWRVKKHHAESLLRTHDLPPLASFLDDNALTGRALKPANELRLRCTEFDEKGDVTLVNGEFKKSELIAKYGLLPRDLRKIDSSLLPTILIRPSAIMLNLLHLRVLIKHNRVLVFDVFGSADSYTQSVFMYDLEGKLRQQAAAAQPPPPPPATPAPTSTTAAAEQAPAKKPGTGAYTRPGDLPYEFRALEAVLISVTAGLEGEFEGVREPVVRVLRGLEEADIDRDKLRHLLVYSKKLGTFAQKARLVRDALDELLDADDDLAAMYLTEAAAGRARSEDEHSEVELLLESYHKVADEIVQAAENLVSNIRNTEEIVRAILDSNRNSLMLLELRFSIWTLGLTAGTFVAALYGMNLKNFIEESDLGFTAVSAVCAAASVAAVSVGIRKLRKVQRVSMWGGGGGGGGVGDGSGSGGGKARLGFWERGELPMPGGRALGRHAGGYGGGAAADPRAGRRNDYWIRRRREHAEEKMAKWEGEHGARQQREKLAKQQRQQQEGGGGGDEGGYC